jgi:hypothetical protein
VFLPDLENAPSDFDFFIGSWRVEHARLRERLTGCKEWDRFNGRCTAKKILGGFGNIDDNELELPSGTYRAATLRTFDPKSKNWSIWWVDGRYAHHLDVPVRGAFENNIGTFLTNDQLNGKPIVVRFRWLKNKDGTPTWEQAFSPDNGSTWETNWTMRFLAST